MSLSTADWTLAQWMLHMQAVHATRVQLGLERVRMVASDLDLLKPGATVITVGGTNGKGSTVAALSTLYMAAGFKVGAFTSPYLFRYNEEIAINGVPVTDQTLCEAFTVIEAVRKGRPLTIFEYGLLAALWIFKNQPLEVIVLEVGLGGRLDAVNIIDADLAVITSIGIDHTEWLGDTREKIGFEKAGIMRPKQWVVCGDTDPPVSLLNHAKQLGTRFYQRGKDFWHEEGNTVWSWHDNRTDYHDLPYNTLTTANMATALMAVTLLQPRLPVSLTAIKNGFSQTQLPGRIQVLDKNGIEIHDVAHNPDAVRLLASFLAKTPGAGNTIAVFSMLRNKDIAGSIAAIQSHVDEWFIAELAAERAAHREQLLAAFKQQAISRVMVFDDMVSAYQAAKRKAGPDDRLVVFGSFYVVAAVQAF